MEKGDPKREEREASLEIIASLTLACEQLASGQKKSSELEWMKDDAGKLAREWIGDNAGIKTVLLTALVVALRQDQELVEKIHRQDHERFERIQRCFPNELRQLGDAICFDEYKDLVDSLRLMKWDRRLERRQPLTKEQLSERARNKVRRPGYGLIGEQFGSSVSLGGLRWVEPTCFDDIFYRRSVNMTRLVELFGVERHRLLELAVEKRRFTYLSIVAIMKKLLRQRPIPPRQKRKRSKPGAPRRKPWLNDEDLRKRVFDGIQERLDRLSVSQDIRAAFEEVVRCYSGQSGKK